MSSEIIDVEKVVQPERKVRLFIIGNLLSLALLIGMFVNVILSVNGGMDLFISWVIVGLMILLLGFGIYVAAAKKKFWLLWGILSGYVVLPLLLFGACFGVAMVFSW